MESRSYQSGRYNGIGVPHLAPADGFFRLMLKKGVGSDITRRAFQETDKKAGRSVQTWRWSFDATWRVLPLESVLKFRDNHTGAGLMIRGCASATLALMLAGLAYGADATDSLTGLPMPDAAAGIKLYEPIKLDPAQVCKSTQVTNFYSTSGFKTSAAIAWYGAHLKGFQHLHGYGAGRTQDVFVNADGTLDVVITGSPGPDGADSEAYAISYATLKPGMSQKTFLGMLSQKMTC